MLVILLTDQQPRLLRRISETATALKKKGSRKMAAFFFAALFVTAYSTIIPA
jgi:hypothetical protein